MVRKRMLDISFVWGFTENNAAAAESVPAIATQSPSRGSIRW